jgi:hypothetical protein
MDMTQLACRGICQSHSGVSSASAGRDAGMILPAVSKVVSNIPKTMKTGIEA